MAAILSARRYRSARRNLYRMGHGDKAAAVCRNGKAPIRAMVRAEDSIEAS